MEEQYLPLNLRSLKFCPAARAPWWETDGAGGGGEGILQEETERCYRYLRPHPGTAGADGTDNSVHITHSSTRTRELCCIPSAMVSSSAK